MFRDPFQYSPQKTMIVGPFSMGVFPIRTELHAEGTGPAAIYTFREGPTPGWFFER